MPLPEPVVDHRSYRQLVSEALSRVPAHTPEWTNLSDSDPGVTLLQLFAFMAESVIYRANRIPERNRRKFLRLLDLPLRPAAAAQGLVRFANPRGPLQTVTLEADRELFAGQVPFRTERGLDVLPLETAVYVKRPLDPRRRAEVESLYRRLHASLEVAGASLDFYATELYTTPDTGVTLPVLDFGRRPSPSATSDDEAPASTGTIDGAVWIALLARPRDDRGAVRNAIAGRVLSLGVMPPLDAAGCVLPAGGDGTDTSLHGGVSGDSGGAAPELIFELPDVTGSSGSAPRYRRLVPRGDVDLLSDPGVVELQLPPADDLRTWTDLGPQRVGTGAYPPSLEDSNEAERLITWLRVRLPEGTGTSGGLGARVSWLGINAARAVQRAEVRGELLPSGTGAPDQSATLVNTPVLVDTLRLTVNGETWTRIDDLSAAGPEVPERGPRLASEESREAAAVDARPVKVYTADRESGTIRFGDGARGMRPPASAVIQASYAYGGGRRGMVGIGAVTRASALPAGVKVSNAVPFWGGDEAETVAEAERAIPATLRHRERLVSARDFAEITWRTPGVDLGRVEILPLLHPETALRGVSAPGVVTVLVIPRFDPGQPDAPRADRLVLETVCRHLEPRRLVTTELHVRGPEYVGVWVSVGLEVVPGRAAAPVLEAARRAVREFLSPLSGGFEGRGWPLGGAVEAAEIAAAVTRVAGVAQVKTLRLAGRDGAETSSVALGGLELPRLLAVAVREGEPAPIEELRTGTPASAADSGTTVVPVPVIPEEC